MNKNEYTSLVDDIVRHLKQGGVTKGPIPKHQKVWKVLELTRRHLEKLNMDKTIENIDSIHKEMGKRMDKYFGKVFSHVILGVVLLREYNVDFKKDTHYTEEERDAIFRLNGYINNVNLGVYSWLRKGKAIRDKRQPKGSFGEIGESRYRFYENGVMQRYDGEVTVNLDGTNEENPVYHLTKVGDIDDFFVSKEELLLALFKDDPKNPKAEWYTYTSEGKIKFTSDPKYKSSTRRTRLGIFKEEGIKIPKVKGRNRVIFKRIRYTREETDKLLRIIKDKLSNVESRYVVRNVNGKKLYTIHEDKYNAEQQVIILKLKEFMVNGKLRLNQKTFYKELNK